MKANEIECTGAIFCGGKSTRMGQDKAGIKLPSGISMIEHVHDAMHELCKEIVIVGHGKGVPESLRNLRRIEDKYTEIGPIGGLEALLSSEIGSEYLIAPCDLIHASPELFSFLLAQKAKLPIVLANEEKIEPLIGRYSSELLEQVVQHIEEKRYAMHDLLQDVEATIIQIPEHLLHFLNNANSPDDLPLI